MIGRTTLAIGLLTLATTVRAQPRATLPQPANRAQVVEFMKSPDPLRQAGAYGTAVGVLTGTTRRADLPPDSVAKALVDLATSDADVEARTRAATVFISAGKPNKPDRYGRAGLRLAEVFHGSTDVGIRTVAMGGVVQVAGAEEALVFLKPIAATTAPQFPGEQRAAINLIGELNTSAAAAFLRELDRSATVTDYWAAGALRSLASTGYRAPRPPSN